MTFILFMLFVLTFVMLLVMSVVGYIWREAEEAKQRQRLRHRANGGSVASWAEFIERQKGRRP